MQQDLIQHNQPDYLLTRLTATLLEESMRHAIAEARIDEMKREKEAAEEASRAKSSFLAKASHELRTPLHAIIGFTNILLENKEGHLQKKEIDFLQRILLNAKDQLQFINDLLDLSKVEAGKMEAELAQVSVRELIGDLVKQLEGRRRSSEVELITKVPYFVAPILTDPAKLKQVLTNLVDNALKFTEHGSVTIDVQVHPVRRAPVRIQIIDTGPGIPPDHIREIFEPFRQLQTEGERPVQSGTGLGLAISRSICELLGFQLQVQSEPGQGSIFTILLQPQL